MLSSKHKCVTVENNDKCLPETVSHYNKIKFAVDMTDQTARKYTTKSKSCRWPLQVFFNILELAGINAWILYRQRTGGNISRQDNLIWENIKTIKTLLLKGATGSNYNNKTRVRQVLVF